MPTRSPSLNGEEKVLEAERWKESRDWKEPGKLEVGLEEAGGEEEDDEEEEEEDDDD